MTKANETKYIHVNKVQQAPTSVADRMCNLPQFTKFMQAEQSQTLEILRQAHMIPVASDDALPKTLLSYKCIKFRLDLSVTQVVSTHKYVNIQKQAPAYTACRACVQQYIAKLNPLQSHRRLLEHSSFAPRVSAALFVACSSAALSEKSWIARSFC